MNIDNRIKGIEKINCSNINLINNVIMLSSLGYLFTSIGNPIVFHPSLVMMNAITLYHIKIEKLNE